MDVSECIERGLLKKIDKSNAKSIRSLEIAKMKLEKAVKLQIAGFFEEALISSYSCIFHASRAILFRDGYKEKSHYAVYVYMREKYRDKLEPRFINELDALRLERHEIMYSLELTSVKKDEAIRIIEIAKDFMNAIKKML